MDLKEPACVTDTCRVVCRDIWHSVRQCVLDVMSINSLVGVTHMHARPPSKAGHCQGEVHKVHVSHLQARSHQVKSGAGELTKPNCEKTWPEGGGWLASYPLEGPNRRMQVWAMLSCLSNAV